MKNHWVKVTEIANSLGISSGTVETILHTKLGMSKVSSRWMPRKMTPEMKQTRVDACRELLDWYTSDSENFFSRVVTGDETWLHHGDPENKQESMQWKHKSSLLQRSSEPRHQLAIMATVFWNVDGVIMID